jgi:hypothetical protein
MELFQDPTFRLWYIAGGMLLLIGPMLWLSRWYHRNIGSPGEHGSAMTPGGRELMQRQRANRPRAHVMPDLGEAAATARDIASGRYGQHAKRMQNRVYWVAGVWVAALTAYFGLLIWADEMARVAPAPP